MMGSVGLTWAPIVIQLYQVAGNDRGGGTPIADGGGDKLFYIRNDIATRRVSPKLSWSGLKQTRSERGRL
jgi:hypothetical protein